MKRFLLIITAAVFAATLSFAQQTIDRATIKSSRVQDLRRGLNVMTQAPQMSIGKGKVVTDQATAHQSTVSKAYADGVYYYRPEGTMWQGVTEKGYSSYYSLLIVPPCQSIVFENQASNPTKCTWSINGTDYTDSADENGDLDYGTLLYDGYGYYLPTLTYGSYTYTLGEWNTYLKEGILFCDSIDDISFIDQSYYSGADVYTIGSGMSEGWLYGPSIISDTDENGDTTATYTVYAVETDYPGPLSPLYIENAHFLVYANSTTPMESGKELTMYFLDSNDWEAGTATIIGSMTATLDDCTLLGGPYDATGYIPSGQVYMYNVTFSAKGTDVFGNTYEEPITIPAGQDFTIYLDGLDQDGINFGFWGQTNIDADRHFKEYTYSSGSTTWDVTFLDVYDNDDGAAYMLSYPETQWTISLKGGFDFIEVYPEVEYYTDATYTTTETYTDMNILNVSDDGTTVTNAGYTDIDYVYAIAAYDWVNQGTGEEEYSYELPDWIDELVVEEGSYGYKYISVSCQALPSGTDSRYALISLEGKGYTSEYSILVTQGSVDTDNIDTSGISSAVAITGNKQSTSKTYNLAGQLVDSSYKGIVVKNGHKFVRK